MSLAFLYIARSNNSFGVDCQKILVNGEGSLPAGQAHHYAAQVVAKNCHQGLSFRYCQLHAKSLCQLSSFHS
jgi:hypothetical protein